MAINYGFEKKEITSIEAKELVSLEFSIDGVDLFALESMTSHDLKILSKYTEAVRKGTMEMNTYMAKVLSETVLDKNGKKYFDTYGTKDVLNNKASVKYMIELVNRVSKIYELDMADALRETALEVSNLALGE